MVVDLVKIVNNVLLHLKSVKIKENLYFFFYQFTDTRKQAHTDTQAHTHLHNFPSLQTTDLWLIAQLRPNMKYVVIMAPFGVPNGDLLKREHHLNQQANKKNQNHNLFFTFLQV